MLLRTRRLICLLALILAIPTAAFAQGAGDDQYQDPFGDEPSAQAPQGDDGLGDEPPGGGDSGSDSGSSGSGGSGTPGGEAPQGPSGTGPATTPATPATPSNPNALPYTGSDPRPLLLVGAAFLFGGIGLRLRTIDPNDF